MTLDSRHVQPGALFCCVPGHTFDGHDFAQAAVDSGAVALLSERPLELGVPQIVVDAVRPALGPLADALNGHPSRAMTVVGITGTNGKTTTAHLLASMFEAAGWRAATLGTLSGTRTTPEAPALQGTLAELRRGGVDAIAMEVSSHALSQHRVDGVRFAAATFTNLSQDHLDFHQTMEQYFAAKAELFRPGRAAIAVVNADDPWGLRLLDRLAGARVVTFSMADVMDVMIDGDGSRFRWHGIELSLRLGGRINIPNALAAATTAEALAVPPAAIAEGLAAVNVVPGRFQSVDLGQPFQVLVDYAHTPVALEQALLSARELTTRRVIVVFGCGGDRDQAKRPLMGAVATRLADLVVLTSDNPRGEDPQHIIDEVRRGAESGRGHGAAGPGRLVVEPDRAAAIAKAFTAARADDVVVIAGKGHETSQELADGSVPFDDRQVAGALLSQPKEAECSPS
jgi:UDP-N-acetylmuramoyl-L-alanyl-D-glutamate--2,6-diaminopimelate ligase